MKEAVSVSQLNKYIKEMFSDDNVLKNVIVKGEISNLKESRGNYYFSLKDDMSSIQCIIFTNYSGMSVDIQNISDGLEVIVYGKVAVYEKGGTYSIYVNKIDNTGLGEYFVKLEELKKKLYELGMFDQTYKKQIPKYSINIGVVTAKNGAAIRDIYKTIKDKNPYANVILYPSLVQGDNAYKSIIDGIMELDKMDLDVIIVGRGGGSIEDLYCFNDERVAYAIFNAKTPIISAVGHEINDSISDLVADARVATPTAAGELATFSYSEFENDLENYKRTFDDIIEDKIENIKTRLENVKRQLSVLAPKARIERYNDNLVNMKELLRNSIDNKMLLVKSRLDRYIEMLKSRDVLDKISKGLAYTTDEKGNRIKSIKNVKVGNKIYSRVKDGTIESKVLSLKSSLGEK
ncbi:MAG: exodeoxyribonuclease VII large subunit [Lachnospiraceae bacterium]|nr:exodeoxyribonuclease VII large subunit [Lachnospiraceae bacterium]